MVETRFQKGQAVGFRMGMREVHGIVKEDRGPIGVNGRRLYAVEYPGQQDSPDPSMIELPADQLVFEFNDLDALLQRANDLKPNEQLQVRWIGHAAQGALLAIKADARFNDFEASVAEPRQPFQKDDPTLFTISRKPTRKRSAFRSSHSQDMRL